MNCTVCNRPIEIDIKKFDSGSIPQYCSRECQKHGVASSVASTMMTKYGCANPGQVPEIAARAKASRQLKESETVKKRQATMLERYGATSAMGCPELRSKIEATNLARYGAANPSKNKDIQQKIREIAMSEEFHSGAAVIQLVALLLNDAGIETLHELYLDPYWYDIELVGGI